MAVTVNKCDLRLSLDAIQTLDSVDLSTPSEALNRIFSQIFVDGTGNGQLTGLWHDRRVLAALGNDDIDLAGVLLNVYGETLTFTVIKFILIKNQSALVTAGHATATTTILTIGATVTNEFDQYNIPCETDGFTFINNPRAGVTVTAGTADILRITNTDASEAAQFDIILGGLV